jgi:autotransporter-associated beta strand protein
VTGSPAGNSGVVIQNGFNAVTLTGNNTYTGGTTINAGTLQVGNGGTSGSIGTGNTANESMLVFNRSDNVTYDGVISGAGSVVQQGSGTLMLNGVNTYTGLTTVSNGMFGGTGMLAGPVTLEAGTTLAPGAPVGSVGTLTINSDLSIGGNLAIEVNKSLSPSNDLVVVSGALTKTGPGTLTVANLGPALAVGDKFTLFSQPVANGAALTVTGGGATWTNNLAVDGSIQVLTVTMTQQPHIVTPAVSGAGLVFSGTNGLANGGYQILSSTNVAAPLSSWTQIVSGTFDGSGKMSVTNAINLGEPQRYFLLRLP